MERRMALYTDSRREGITKEVFLSCPFITILNIFIQGHRPNILFIDLRLPSWKPKAGKKNTSPKLF